MSKKKNYAVMTIPELYLLAEKRGMVKYFGKDESEMAILLSEWDEKHSEDEELEEAPPTGNKKTKPKKKSFRAAAERLVDEEEELDELLDIDDLDEEDESDETVTEKVSKRLGTSMKTRSGRDDEEEEDEPVVEDDTDDLLSDIFEDDDVDKNNKPNPKKEKEMATKKSAVKKPAAKKAATKKPAAKKAETSGAEAPYTEGTAGFCAYLALKKGGKMDLIVSNTEKLIAKYKAKPSANTAGKVKIIMTEINKGKKGDKWGRFTLNEKTGRISHIPA
jgi:hypothetical protein